MNRVWIAGYQRMPVKQGNTFVDQAISTGFRQPISTRYRIWREHHTIGYQCLPPWICRAVAGVMIEVTTGNSGVINITIVLILEFMQATFTTTVAQCFPFTDSHFL